MALTDLQIRKLVATNERREVWDGRVPGFGIRISAHGTKSFVLLYRHGRKSHRMTLGRYPILSVAEARRRALIALGTLTRGVDPDAKRGSGEAQPFVAAVDQFIDIYCAQHNRPSTRRETARLLRTRFVNAWGARELRDIRKTDVIRIIDQALGDGAPSAANHALATIRVFFNWCMDRGLIDTNPCERLKMPAKLIAKDRVLDDAEIGRVWIAARLIGYPFGTMVQLLMLTAQRRNEVATMRWSDVNWQTRLWSIPAELTKNGQSHAVPLGKCLLEILKALPRIDDVLLFPSRAENGRSFSGFSRSKGRLERLAGVKSFTLHDLRRTAATRMAELGVAPHVVERLLNHSGGILGGVAGIYNRYQYREEIRNALAQWENHVLNCAGQHSIAGEAQICAVSI